MKPVAITDEMVADLINANIVTYAAPEGEEHRVDAIQGLFELGVVNRFGPDRIYLPFMPSREEIIALAAGEPLWLVVMGHRMPVVQVYVQALPGDPDVLLIGGPHDGLGVRRETVRVEAGGLQERIHIDATGSVYELVGANYVFVEDGVAPLETAGTESGPEAES